MVAIPDDPIGTVRATSGFLAIRAHAQNDAASEELSWFIVQIGEDNLADAPIETQLHTWAIVYQPNADRLVTTSGDVVAVWSSQHD